MAPLSSGWIACWSITDHGAVVTKNSLFTQFLRLSGMRPGVGIKGKHVSGTLLFYYPIVKLQLFLFPLFVTGNGEERGRNEGPRKSTGCPKGHGWRPLLCCLQSSCSPQPHSKHRAAQSEALPSGQGFILGQENHPSAGASSWSKLCSSTIWICSFMSLPSQSSSASNVSE